MARAPFQVLVIPFFISEDGVIKFALFRRQDSSGGFWQWISGGGEDKETHEQAARREALEEGGIHSGSEFIRLHSSCTIQRDLYHGHENWHSHPYVIPEYAFAVRLKQKKIERSSEHQDQKWVGYDEAMKLLKWDSNRTALWELMKRIGKSD